MLTIGVDFDGTFSADTTLFCSFVELAYARGHTVVIVTSRRGSDRDVAWMQSKIAELPPVVFAAGEWKRWAAINAGYSVDVWIDDLPEYIGAQSAAGSKVRFIECRSCAGQTPEDGAYCTRCGDNIEVD